MPDYIKLMTAQVDVQIDLDSAREWFLGLKDHPERYAFASHEGFTFIEGDFGEVGAQFYTIEHFHGMRTKLTFSLTEITPNSFTFELSKPIRNVKGQFTLTQRDKDITTVSLSVYAPNKYIKQMFAVKPLYQAVKKQITGEVQHIKTSMENLS